MKLENDSKIAKSVTNVEDRKFIDKILTYARINYDGWNFQQAHRVRGVVVAHDKRDGWCVFSVPHPDWGLSMVELWTSFHVKTGENVTQRILNAVNNSLRDHDHRKFYPEYSKYVE